MKILTQGIAVFFMLELLQACAGTHFIFSPVKPTPLNTQGIEGAMFAIPEGQDKSTVRFLPMGIRKKEGSSFLVIRYYFENQGGKPWKMDAQFQKLKLKGSSLFISAWIKNPTPATTHFDIPSEFSRVYDFDFPLPESMKSDADIAGFELSWKIVTPAGPIEGVTEFTRKQVNDSTESSAVPLKKGRTRS